MVSFRKNRDGEWVVFGPAREIAANSSVTVQKADGSLKIVQVAEVSKTFDVGGVAHVYGMIAKSTATATPTPKAAGHRCAECGRSGATKFCYDSSGIGGYCCQRCSSISRYERSFA